MLYEQHANTCGYSGGVIESFNIIVVIYYNNIIIIIICSRQRLSDLLDRRKGWYAVRRECIGKERAVSYYYKPYTYKIMESA